MLYLNKSANNKINVTLSQDVVLTGMTNDYTLYLYSQQNLITGYTLSLSGTNGRYDLFYLTGSSINTVDGYYNYYITNNFSGVTGTTIETGKAFIYTSGTTLITTTYPKYTDTSTDSPNQSAKIFVDTRI